MFQKFVFFLVLSLHLHLFSDEATERLEVRGVEAVKAANELAAMINPAAALFQSILEIEEKGSRPLPKMVALEHCSIYAPSAGSMFVLLEKEGAKVCCTVSANLDNFLGYFDLTKKAESELERKKEWTLTVLGIGKLED